MRLFQVLGPLWLSAACTPPGAEPPGAPADRDGDGFDALADCDDNDATIHPGAAERCDGVDNDCDGSFDEDLSVTSYFDGDQDGYGSNETSIVTCGIPEGFVAISGDCDDHDETIRPGAPERCDGEDNNCDGVIDEDAVDVGVFFRDQDGDQVGDDAQAVVRCAAPDGYVSAGGDCDDANPERFPGNPERCDGGADNDCDPVTTDDGAVTFTTRHGVSLDLTEIFASGTETYPALYYVEQPGQIRFCGGAWVGALVIAADVDIVGEGGARSNILDAAEQMHSIKLEDGAGVVSIEGMTFTRGHANTAGFSGSRRSGGGLFCDTGAEIALEDVVISAAEAEAGGGMYVSGCAVTLSDATLSDNVGIFGGAIAMDAGSLVLVRSTVSDNVSKYYAGGAYLYNNLGDIRFSMIDSLFLDNAADFVGAIYAFDYHTKHTIEASCEATEAHAAGIIGSAAIDLGAVYAYTPDSGAFSSDGCDFGEPGTVDDNLPEDVHYGGPEGVTASRWFGDGASFVCSADLDCR